MKTIIQLLYLITVMKDIYFFLKSLNMWIFLNYPILNFAKIQICSQIVSMQILKTLFQFKITIYFFIVITNNLQTHKIVQNHFLFIFEKILAHCRIVGSTSLSNCLLSSCLAVLSSCLLSNCLLSSCLLSNCQGANKFTVATFMAQEKWQTIYF